MPFRSDAFLTRYVFHPLRRLRASGSGIPILMYHSVSDAKETGKHPYYQTVTSLKSFARQMRFLSENGYAVLTVEDAIQRTRQARQDLRAVVITFDDGFRDFYNNAFPVLNQYGFAATMYLPTDYIGNTPRKFNGIECMTWDEIRELRRAGIGFGSHTVTHPQLKSIRPEEVLYEVQASKQTIEGELGESIKSFAYPYAFPEQDREFARTLRGFLTECGYENSVCTVIGTLKQADDAFFINRLPVNSHDEPELFRAKLEGGYDWVHGLQYASKMIRRG